MVLEVSDDKRSLALKHVIYEPEYQGWREKRGWWLNSVFWIHRSLKFSQVLPFSLISSAKGRRNWGMSSWLKTRSGNRELIED